MARPIARRFASNTGTLSYFSACNRAASARVVDRILKWLIQVGAVSDDQRDLLSRHDLVCEVQTTTCGQAGSTENVHSATIQRITPNYYLHLALARPVAFGRSTPMFVLVILRGRQSVRPPRVRWFYAALDAGGRGLPHRGPFRVPLGIRSNGISRSVFRKCAAATATCNEMIAQWGFGDYSTTRTTITKKNPCRVQTRLRIY
jgi:hypothetical protein